MTGYIEARDENNVILDSARWNLLDKDKERKIFTIFKNKFGIFKKPEISNEESINNNFFSKKH